jgi:hypothetical protein
MTKITCNQLVPLIDDIIDGVLDEPEATTVRAHLDDCPTCRSEIQRGRDLVAAARSLPRSIEPERELWTGIRDRIETRRVVSGRFDRSNPPPSRRLWWAAAAAVFIVSISVAYMAGMQRSRTVIAEDPRTDHGVIEAAYAFPAEDLEAARDLLRAGLDRRRDELSTETWSVVMDNMAVIDDAIERIEIALAENPSDGRLNRQLTAAYRRQIDLLQRATRLPAEV